MFSTKRFLQRFRYLNGIPRGKSEILWKFVRRALCIFHSLRFSSTQIECTIYI